MQLHPRLLLMYSAERNMVCVFSSLTYEQGYKDLTPGAPD